MPEKSRRELLEGMLAAEPADAFLRYGLAMEFVREGKSADAITALRQLVADRPDYVAAFQQLGQLLIERGDDAAAADALRRGIAAAASTGNRHAAEEMTGLLEQIS